VGIERKRRKRGVRDNWGETEKERGTPRNIQERHSNSGRIPGVTSMGGRL